MESLLERVALAAAAAAAASVNATTATDPNPNASSLEEIIIPEIRPWLETNPKPVLDFLTPYLFNIMIAHPLKSVSTDETSVSTSPSPFVWNSKYVLVIYKYFIQYKSTLLLDISQSVFKTMKQHLLSTLSLIHTPPPSLTTAHVIVSDDVLQTLLELLLHVNLEIAENASQTLLAITLYHKFIRFLIRSTATPPVYYEEEEDGFTIIHTTTADMEEENTSPSKTDATDVLSSSSSSSSLLSSWEDRFIQAFIRSFQTYNNNNNNPNKSSWHIRNASTLVQLLQVEWNYNKMFIHLQESKKVKQNESGYFQQERILPTWVTEFLSQVATVITESYPQKAYFIHDDNTNIKNNMVQEEEEEESLTLLVLQKGLLDLFFIQPFYYQDTSSSLTHTPISSPDELSRITLLDLLDSIIVMMIRMIHDKNNHIYGYHNIVSWFYSHTVLSTLFSLLLLDSTDDLLDINVTSMIYMFFPSSSSSSSTTTESLVTSFQQEYNLFIKEKKIHVGEEEEKGLILRIVSHIFHISFTTKMFSSLPECLITSSQQQQSQLLYLWSGYHVSLTYFLNKIVPQGRSYDQEAKKLAFIDAMTIYVTTHPWILSSFLNLYESTCMDSSFRGDAGIVHICESWLNLRHAHGSMKASILGSIATVLEQTSSPSLRFRLIVCMGAVNGSSTTPGTSILANLCRISPSVEVRVSSYRCLHELIHDNPIVVQRLFQDPQAQFLNFISGREGNETTKEGKEAKYILLLKILEHEQECKKWITESQWKELKQVVQNGPFTIPPASVWDPLLE